MYALDGAAGTLDPAFEAHASPVLHWALAVWLHWFPSSVLETAFTDASLRLAGKMGALWSAVTGPTSALVVTLERIGWSMPSFIEAVDDRGHAWRFDRDSPGAIAAACKESVRRWRLSRIGDLLPGLIPQQCDVGSPQCDTGTVLVYFAHVLGPLISGKGAGARTSDHWRPLWRGDLLSAISGGQWTQARKASVPAWGIDDSSCQLCRAATGTLEHRFECKATEPPEGWPQPPPAATHLLRRLSAQRKQLLATRGLLVLRLPAPPPDEDGYFQWDLEPDYVNLHDTCWYFDGSLLNGKWKAYRTTGFGIVVTSTAGDLLGYGKGAPPSWGATAAAAEAWALRTVLSVTPFPPQMRTDCLSLLTTASVGVARATDPRKALARIWCHIAATVDGELEQLAADNLLVWLPAHQSMASVGEAKLSSGARLSQLDWRANRLVDGLAKAAAARRQPPLAVTRVLKWGREAVVHAAQLLGRVTHQANNHKVLEVGPDGVQATRTYRDSADAPRTKPCRRTAAKPAAAAPAAKPVLREVVPWQPSNGPSGLRARRTPRAHSASAFDRQHLQRRVQEIGDALRAPDGRAAAADRLQALRARVLARAPAPQ